MVQLQYYETVEVYGSLVRDETRKFEVSSLWTLFSKRCASDDPSTLLWRAWSVRSRLNRKNVFETGEIYRSRCD